MKIEDLKVGDELVCVDREGFNALHFLHRSINEFKVSEIKTNCFHINGCNWVITEEELKYFKKKEQYTFNDLIDVAVQAYKDGILSSLVIDDDEIAMLSESFNESCVCGQSLDEGINFIQSLYKETFVIESEEDIKRLNYKAKTTLKNGEVIYFSNIDDGNYWFEFDDYNVGVFPFIALKGATVEQERNDQVEL